MQAIPTDFLRQLLENDYIVITSDEQYEHLQHLALTGFISFGFHFGKKQSEAKLTEIGRTFVEHSLNSAENKEHVYI